MKTWKQFINEAISGRGGDPEKIEASDFSPADLESKYEPAFCLMDQKSVWTDTHVHTFLWDCEGYDYTYVQVARNPSKPKKTQRCFVDDEGVIYTVFEDNTSNCPSAIQVSSDLGEVSTLTVSSLGHGQAITGTYTLHASLTVLAKEIEGNP